MTMVVVVIRILSSGLITCLPLIPTVVFLTRSGVGWVDQNDELRESLISPGDDIGSGEKIRRRRRPGASSLMKTTLSDIRQYAAIALCVLALEFFMTLIIICYMVGPISVITPGSQVWGLLTLAISTAIALNVQHNETSRSAEEISRIISVHGKYRKTSTENIMMTYWCCLLWSMLLRIWYTWPDYTWALQGPEDICCMLIILMDILLVIITSAIIYLYFQDPKPENIDQTMIQIYGPTGINVIMNDGCYKNTTLYLKVKFFNLLTFHWLSHIMRKGYRNSLNIDDIPDIDPDNCARNVFARIQKIWRDKSRAAHLPIDTQYSIYSVLLHFVHPEWILNILIDLIQGVFGILNILVLNLLIRSVSDGASASYTLIFPFLMLLNGLCETFIFCQLRNQLSILEMRVASSLSTCVYVKALKINQANIMRFTESTTNVAGQSSDAKNGEQQRRHPPNPTSPLPPPPQEHHHDLPTTLLPSSPLHPTQEEEFTSGRVLNLMSMDAQNLGRIFSVVQILFAAPVQLILTMWLLYLQLGLSSLTGLGVVCLCAPLNLLLMKICSRLDTERMIHKDTRLKMISEICQGIRAIKIYCWENSYMRFINETRSEELKTIKSAQMAGAICHVLMDGIPIITSLIAFGVFTLVAHKPLTPAIAFTCLALFQRLVFPLTALPSVIMDLAEAKVTAARLTRFLSLPEIKNSDPDNIRVRRGSTSPDVRRGSLTTSLNRRRGSQGGGGGATSSSSAPSTSPLCTSPVPSDRLSWKGPAMVICRNLKIKDPSTGRILIDGLSLDLFEKGLVILMGEIGSGKSVLIDTLIGEVDFRHSGDFTIAGKIGLCCQQAWIRSGSIRENILFDKSPHSPRSSVPHARAPITRSVSPSARTVVSSSVIDEERYQSIISACALKPDIDSFPHGDQTLIGERGVNLSTGQKQRVALARAIYADCDIYFIDDILSAVDSHVANHIYKNAIKKLLSKKIVIMTTHTWRSVKKSEDDQICLLRSYQAPLVFRNSFEASQSDEIKSLISERGGSSQRFNSWKSSLIDYDDGDGEGVSEMGGLRRDEMRPVPSQLFFSALQSQEFTAAPDEYPSAAAAAENRASECDQDGVGGLGLESLLSQDGGVDEEDGLSIFSQMDDDRLERGAVKSSVYFDYIRGGGGFQTIFALTLSLIASSLAEISAGFWLSDWSDHRDDMNQSIALMIYTALQATELIILMLGFIILIRITQTAASFFHRKLLSRIVRAKIEFFQATSVGKITNRFGKDFESIDDRVPHTLHHFLQMIISVIGIFSVILFILPKIIFIILPLSLLYYYLERLYVAGAREIRRLESSTRSPIFTHFSETLKGAKTIRAMGKINYFLKIHLDYLEQNMKAFYTNHASRLWLNIRLQLLSNLIIFTTALYCCLGGGRGVSGGGGGSGPPGGSGSPPGSGFSVMGGLSGGRCGLVLTYAITLTGYIDWLVHMSGDRESEIVAVERILDYDRDIHCPQELYSTTTTTTTTTTLVTDTTTTPPKQPDTTTLLLEGLPPTSPHHPPPDHEDILTAADPADRSIIHFDDVLLQYRPGLPYALKGISFRIERGQKIGIVGRTGSGKTSLINTLLKLVEPTAGTIVVNGRRSCVTPVDIWRQSMAVIPQEPIIFSGSVRRNLDPDHTAVTSLDDGKIWNALEKCCLRSFVENLPDQLDHLLLEGGMNLSGGQRQLICLARVLLKKAHCPLLILDEATSSVDQRTDSLIQQCLRTEFWASTILTIAHRIDTVLDYDLIFVMRDGRVCEAGPPQHLLQNPKSAFHSLYKSIDS